jgi:hypothetical protein
MAATLVLSEQTIVAITVAVKMIAALFFVTLIAAVRVVCGPARNGYRQTPHTAD